MTVQYENMAIILSVVLIFILLLKRLLGTRITPRGHMLLWVLAGLLFIGSGWSQYLPQSPLAIQNYIPHQQESRIGEMFGGDAPIQGVWIEDEGAVYEVVRSDFVMKIPGSEKVWMKPVYKTLAFEKKIWQRVLFLPIGMGLLWLFGAAWYQRRKLKKLPLCSDEGVLEIFRKMKERVGVSGEVAVRMGSENTMVVAGLFRGPTTIYLEEGYTEEELPYIFAHELTHMKHGDLGWNVIGCICLCSFWWNPLIWLGFRRLRHDMEVYCDYSAAKLTGDKKGYARMLVKAAARPARFIAASSSLLGGEKEVTTRVKALAAFRRPKTWLCIAAVLLVVLVGIGLILQPVDAELPASEGESFQSQEDLLAEEMPVLELMGDARAEDFLNPEEYGTITPEALAEALAGARPSRISRQEARDAGYSDEEVKPWQMYGVQMGEGVSLNVLCGWTEPIVKVEMRKGEEWGEAYFRSPALYELVRHQWDYEEIIDEADFEKFSDILTALMEFHLSSMSENSGDFTDYQLTRFHRVWAFEETAGGGRVELYDFDYALLTDHPEDIAWAGGMRLDSQKRLQGFNGGGQFAVRYLGEQVVSTAFMGNDFYYSSDPPENSDAEAWMKEQIGSALDLRE